MEFEKIFNFFVVCVVGILLLTTLVSMCFVVVSKAKGNLGAVSDNICLESCTQILQHYC
jgi:hypothetical protein